MDVRPSVLITDQEQEFVNNLFTEWHAVTNTEHGITSTNHPQVISLYTAD